MANPFNRADSGFSTAEYQGRRPNLADQHGQHPIPSRVQERISSYRGILDWQTLEKYLKKIWPNETTETLQHMMIDDHWVFLAPRRLRDSEREQIARVRDEKRRAERQRRRSESPE
ncbi:hypothetical protein F4823DRAFT_437780 [Ustulina deusta]|nr:hypothetical protein F4823DRAFT_437780 [Ustulina deusta]